MGAIRHTPDRSSNYTPNDKDRNVNRRLTIADAAWLLGFGLASAVWWLTVTATLGPTVDEPIYLRCGLDHCQTGSYKRLLRQEYVPRCF